MNLKIMKHTKIKHTEYYPFRVRKSREYYLNENYEKDGIYKEWYENLRLYKKCTFHHGKLDGKCLYWYEDGGMWVECYHRNDQLDGEYKEWDSETQELIIHCYYRKGKLDGEYKEWNYYGELCCHLYFVMGVEITLYLLELHQSRYFNILEYNDKLYYKYTSYLQKPPYELMEKIINYLLS